MNNEDKIGGDSNWFICHCGNEPNRDGFFSAKTDGSITSPSVNGEWDERTYVCLACGRIIDAPTLVIVGKASMQIRLDNNRFDWSTY